jgi:uncharacterized cupredoxin-like copper-binding protein
MTVGGGPLKPYIVNRRVVLIIGFILSISAMLTIGAGLFSEVPHRDSLKDRISKLLVTLHLPLIPSMNSNHTSQHLKVDKKLVLIQHEYGFNGTTGGPTISLNKGETVQITVINAGYMAHNFGIAKLSKQSLDLLKKTDNETLPERMKNIPYDALAAIPCPGCVQKFSKGQINSFILPGARAETTLLVQEAGNFKYFCMVRGHLWLGMMGDFIVHDSGIKKVGLSRNK